MRIVAEHARFLPEIEVLLRRSRAAAALDAILMPTWTLRYYSYDPHWNTGQRFACMTNGSGEEYYILVGSNFALVKGFVKASKMAATCGEVGHAVADLLPMRVPVLGPALEEPAFDWQYTTYVAWSTGEGWTIRHASGELGLCKEQCAVLLDDGETYHRWAEEYYEMAIDPEMVNKVFSTGRVARMQLSTMCPGGVSADLERELMGMGALVS